MCCIRKLKGRKKKIWGELQTGSCSEETTLEMGSKRKKKKKDKREGGRNKCSVDILKDCRGVHGTLEIGASGNKKNNNNNNVSWPIVGR